MIAKKIGDKSLDGVRVLITGAGSGIGLATATLFAQHGAAVAANHLVADILGKQRLDALVLEGFDVHSVPGDVSHLPDAEEIVEKSAHLLGGIDVLVNNAGTSGVAEPIPFGDVYRIDEELWRTVLQTNLIGAFRVSKSAVLHLKSTRGAIVNVASVAGLGGDASSIPYAASKAGLINVTRNLAKGLGPDIRVNAVAPGLTRTAWIENWSEVRKRQSVEKTILNRFVEPSDVAEAIIFLASHRAITGQTLAVDCGRIY